MYYCSSTVHSGIAVTYYVLQAMRKYRNSDFGEELYPSAPVGFCFLDNAIELHIPFSEAEHQGYTIEVDIFPCKVSILV